MVYGDRHFTLSVNAAYAFDSDSMKKDTADMGDFKGMVTEQTFNELTRAMIKMNLDSLEYHGSNCCDAPLKTFTVYYNNGKSKGISVMFPPPIMHDFINVCYRICSENPRVRDIK
jgi:hypothetical protein